jgi:para-aminobenzoate synthetase component I
LRPQHFCRNLQASYPTSQGRSISLHIQEIPWRRPEDCFATLSGEPYLVFLDSAAQGDARSGASYVCLDPLRILHLRQGVVSIDGVPHPGDPLGLLGRELASRHRVPIATPLPFSGGAVGFFGYELGRALEHLPSRHGNSLNMPDMVVGLYDTVIGFDHRARRAWLMLGERAGARLDARVQTLCARLDRQRPRPPLPGLAWQPDFDRASYKLQIERVLGYIRAGDIFQANFTTRHLAPRPRNLDTAALYLALRQASPAPFAAYLDCGPELTLLSASPERFLSLDTERRIEARPIKGTRPRHPDPLRDQAMACELAESSKDRAENLMIVDLLRNDIGKVAEIGSIRVPELYHIESFASVHHMVSSVTGKLRPELGAIDLLRATLPGGSVTGAPKIRAMQIIDELEACRRGPYCGAIAWIGFDGAMDSSIVIRTIIATSTHLLMHAGGGIVADSTADAEYDEMALKAAPMLGVCDV